MAPPTDDEQLILQIFPRSDPSRAVSYSGDQTFIREILRDLARRLEEADPTGQGPRRLSLLAADREEGDDHA